MQRANGPKWVVGAAIAGTLFLGIPAGVWASLPVHSSTGPLRLSARPSRFLSHEFQVKLTNVTPSSKVIEDLPITEQTPYLTCGLSFDRPEMLSPGESISQAYEPGHGTWLMPRSPGLHRIPIYRSTGTGLEASTEIWVLYIGGKTLAIK